MMDAKALVMPVDGPARIIPWPTGSSEHLRTLYREIDCRAVCVVPLDRGDVTVWADDEGLLSSFPVLNAGASVLCGQYVVGTAVVTGGDDGEGDTLGLTGKQAVAILAGIAPGWFVKVESADVTEMHGPFDTEGGARLWEDWYLDAPAGATTRFVKV